MTKNADFDKCKYSRHGLGFDACRSFSLSDGSGFGKNVIIFGADINPSVHVDHRKKDVSVYGKGPTQGLDDTPLTAVLQN